VIQHKIHLSVEEIRDGGMVAIISAQTEHGGFWLSVGVQPEDQGSAKAGGTWDGWATVVPYGDEHVSGFEGHDGDVKRQFLADVHDDVLKLWRDSR